MQVRRRDLQTVEMQMGPMIDMVFLLLVFFMVTAKPIKQESDIDIGLPGTVEQDQSVDIPDEARITIQPSGQVILNDQPLDTPTSSQMPELLTTLLRFKESADANKSEASGDDRAGRRFGSPADRRRAQYLREGADHRRDLCG